MPVLNDNDEPDAEPEHPAEGALAAYVDGALAEVERATIERHLDACRECRAVVVATVRALDETSLTPESEAPRVSRPSAAPEWRRYAMPIAIAASIGAILLVEPDRPGPLTPSSPMRTQSPVGTPGEGLALLPVHHPANGDTVAAAGLTFSWGATIVERYLMVLATEDGTPIWRTDTPDTAIVLPDSVRLVPGRLYFWHVDAVSGGVAATTRMLHFTTLPAP